MNVPLRNYIFLWILNNVVQVLLFLFNLKINNLEMIHIRRKKIKVFFVYKKSTQKYNVNLVIASDYRLDKTTLVHLTLIYWFSKNLELYNHYLVTLNNQILATNYWVNVSVALRKLFVFFSFICLLLQVNTLIILMIYNSVVLFKCHNYWVARIR